MRIANLLRGFGLAGGGGSPPATPALAVSDNADGTGGVATISGSSPGSTNTVLYAPVSTQGSLTLLSAGSRTGDGTVALTAQGLYIWEVISTLSGLLGVSNQVLRALTYPLTIADAWEDRIAEAIATELNDPARGWSGLFTTEPTVAARSRAPWYDDAVRVKLLQRLRADVVPVTIERERKARAGCTSGRQFDYGIPIVLQRMVDPTDDTTLETMSAAAELIHDWFDDGHALSGLPGWICLKAERNDVYSLPQLHDERVWSTEIAVQVRGFRA